MTKRLEDLEIYQDAMSIGNDIWNLVNGWDQFSKNTIGNQLVRSGDSIAANISEGYGRYFFKERRQFSYYSRGSLLESKTWLEKAKKRELISSERHEELIDKMTIFHKKLNGYIRNLNNQI